MCCSTVRRVWEKTTLAYILAREMGGQLRMASGPAIDKSGDLAAILSTIEPGDVLFIDEIHRLPRQVEEILYPAMEDYCLDIVVGKDAGVHTIRLSLPPFTLVGATTRAGDLSAPLRDRFGIVSQLEYYRLPELERIVERTARVMNTEIDEGARREIALRSRGTPRIANRLFRRVRDFAQVLNDGIISEDVAREALDRLHVDHMGLDSVDYRYLTGLIDRFQGGPAGLEALAASIGEESTTLEDMYEPYLLQIGFINRTPEAGWPRKKPMRIWDGPKRQRRQQNVRRTESGSRFAAASGTQNPRFSGTGSRTAGQMA